MERLYSNILGTPIVEDDFHRPVSSVKDLVIDPESGKLLALVVNNAKKLIIVPRDIRAWGERIQISGAESIIEAGEVLRVAEVMKTGIGIFHSKVESLDKHELGLVVDFSLDSQEWGLSKLYTAKVFWGLVRYSERVIDARDIVEIRPRKIIVKADAQTVKEKEAVVVEKAAI